MRSQEAHRERETALGGKTSRSPHNVGWKPLNLGPIYMFRLDLQHYLCCNLERSKDTLACSRVKTASKCINSYPASPMSMLLKFRFKLCGCNPSQTGFETMQQGVTSSLTTCPGLTNGNGIPRSLQQLISS